MDALRESSKVCAILQMTNCQARTVDLSREVEFRVNAIHMFLL